MLNKKGTSRKKKVGLQLLFFDLCVSMAKKLFVGGISYSTTDDGLRDFFSQAGTVLSASVITDRATGRSKGFGFVEMASDEEAQSAIDMLNGKALDGREIGVSEARPQEPRPARGGFNRGGSSNRGGFGGDRQQRW